jgi:hypothetical protein
VYSFLLPSRENEAYSELGGGIFGSRISGDCSNHDEVEVDFVLVVDGGTLLRPFK